MLGYIALCPHFHQPHFQLYRTREEVYRNSYLPWAELIESAIDEMPGFYINQHYSGPFLYWIKREKPEHAERLARLAATGRVGVIGGFADEPFVQLSSRRDDFYYQMLEYDRICREVIGVGRSDWQAVHLVERESGEFTLLEATRAAALCGTPPIFYLDAETFYRSHFSYPGGENDYCLKHFGFKDPFSLTTVGHLPQELLFYGLRDEIAGQSYVSIPVHSLFRYQLLKRNAFISNDNIRIKPSQYLFYIKDSLEKARGMAKQLSREIPPIALIFEDAEKMGQWSSDPEGDKAWMMDFFRLVEKDPDISFISPRMYLEKHGYIATYPAGCSHSYPEWENWTALRGIRGTCFGDDRLHKVIACLRYNEQLIELLEKRAISKLELGMAGQSISQDVASMLERSINTSAERFLIIRKLMDGETGRLYEIANRVRNLVYQEDPKWASRHPCYGAAPYYDAQGLSYLELSSIVLKASLNGLNSEATPCATEVDWNNDGRPEWILEIPGQYAVIEMLGGCISYYHVTEDSLVSQPEAALDILERDIMGVPVAYSNILKHSIPLVLTETDSELSVRFYDEGGRMERSRNSFRAEVIVSDGSESGIKMGFSDCEYKLTGREISANSASVSLEAELSLPVAGDIIVARLYKAFSLSKEGLNVDVNIQMTGNASRQLSLQLEMVTSASPSDEREFRPRSFIGLKTVGESGTVLGIEKDPDDSSAEYEITGLGLVGTICQAQYIYNITGGAGEEFNNEVQFTFNRGHEPDSLLVRPAVKNYYKGLVFPAQSRMGYVSSGIMLLAGRVVVDSRASISFTMNNVFDVGFSSAGYDVVIPITGEAS